MYDPIVHRKKSSGFVWMIGQDWMPIKVTVKRRYGKGHFIELEYPNGTTKKGRASKMGIMASTPKQLLGQFQEYLTSKAAIESALCEWERKKDADYTDIFHAHLEAWGENMDGLIILATRVRQLDQERERNDGPRIPERTGSNDNAR